MKITIEQLEGLEACTDCIAWVKEQKDRSLAALVKEAVKNPVYKTEEGKEYDTLEFCNWGITRLMTRRQAVLYACFAARQVLKIYEDKYPDDDRPRKAIEAAEAYAAAPSKANRQVAWAATAARASARAAREAALASAGAAWAARASARAATAARASAWAARESAAVEASEAAWAARQVLGIYEDKYPDDDRPRKAIEAAEAYAKDPSEVNRQAAAASLTRAATAAGVATEAAWAATASAAASEAAWVAWAAVASRAVATESAARAATAAEAAARMAARTASEAAEAAADKNRMQAKILRYGVGLLMGQKCGN